MRLAIAVVEVGYAGIHTIMGLTRLSHMEPLRKVVGDDEAFEESDVLLVR
jgi:hypothetical protein